MNIADLPIDSDTSDEDYVPSVNKEDIPSELDSDGNTEEPSSDSENSDTKGKKRKKKLTKSKKKVKKDLQESGNSKENKEKLEKNEEDKKQTVDDIWADFMKDTGFRPKNSKTETADVSNPKPKVNETSKTKTNNTQIQSPPEKVKVTQIFEFAGEEVKVDKEVAADSAEARLLNKTSENNATKASKGKRSGGLGGISNVLSQLGKKPKISTLEKSKIDWDKFKKEENIEEELQVYNKGKDGYLDRQDFLQRADLRRFEIERDIRSIERNKRFNSTL